MVVELSFAVEVVASSEGVNVPVTWEVTVETMLTVVVNLAVIDVGCRGGVTVDVLLFVVAGAKMDVVSTSDGVLVLVPSDVTVGILLVCGSPLEEDGLPTSINSDTLAAGGVPAEILTVVGVEAKADVILEVEVVVVVIVAVTIDDTLETPIVVAGASMDVVADVYEEDNTETGEISFIWFVSLFSSGPL